MSDQRPAEGGADHRREGDAQDGRHQELDGFVSLRLDLVVRANGIGQLPSPFLIEGKDRILQVKPVLHYNIFTLKSIYRTLVRDEKDPSDYFVPRDV